MSGERSTPSGSTAGDGLSRPGPGGSGPTVVVAGGGTAGHIEPALAVADAVRSLDPTATVVALGTERGLETRLVPARGYPLELIPPVPLPRKPTMDLLRLPLRVLRAVRATRAVLDRVDADVVVGFGGYVALPAYLAVGRRGSKRRVPLVVHEANADAGIANRIGAMRADRVLAAVPGSGIVRRGEAETVGIPVREAITTLDRAALRAQARDFFGLPAEGPVLLVFGGSQGARSLNEAVAGAAPALAAAGVSVLHAHGPKNTLAVPDLPEHEHAPYRAVPYIERMDLAYAAADAVVCRSGAMTVAEVSAVGLPAVYVPLPHGNGEQELNARPVVDAGGGLLVADSALTPEFVATDVLSLLKDPERLAAAGRAAASAGHRSAATEVARIALDVARSNR